MRVFIQELRFQKKSFIVWVAALIVVRMMYLTLYPTFQSEADTFIEMIEAFPKEIVSALGMDFKGMFTMSGFFAFTNIFVYLMLSILGILWGLHICARESIHQMNDFLLSKPNSRWSILTQKILAGLLLILLVNIVLFAFVYLFALVSKANQTELRHTMLISLMGFLFHMIFFAIGTAIGTFMSRVKNPVGIASGVGFSFYIILLLSRIINVDAMKYFTPYYYADGIEIVTNGIDWKNVIVLIGVSLLLFVVSVIYYTKKDVEA